MLRNQAYFNNFTGSKVCLKIINKTLSLNKSSTKFSALIALKTKYIIGIETEVAIITERDESQ